MGVQGQTYGLQGLRDRADKSGTVPDVQGQWAAMIPGNE